jgi:hypothetical protein
VVSGVFAQDLIAMQAAELNGVCLDITLTSDTGDVLSELKNRPVELVEFLPHIHEVNLHTPLFNLDDGLIHVAVEVNGSRNWLSARLSKY